MRARSARSSRPRTHSAPRFEWTPGTHSRIPGWPTPTPYRRASDSCAARDGYPLAREAAQQALRLDPGLAEPHASLGRVKFSYEWDDGQAAEQEFLRALAINPGYATARQWYAVLLATRRDLDKALTEAQLAAQSDPLSPIIHWNVARTYFFRGEHDAALAAIARALELEADFPMALVLAARVHAQQGRVDEAQRALDQIRAKRPDDVTSESLALGAYIAAIRGDRKTAIGIVKQLEADPASQHVMPYYAAKVYAALKEPDQAFAHLYRAADEQAAQIVFVGCRSGVCGAAKRPAPPTADEACRRGRAPVMTERVAHASARRSAAVSASANSLTRQQALNILSPQARALGGAAAVAQELRAQARVRVEPRQERLEHSAHRLLRFRARRPAASATLARSSSSSICSNGGNSPSRSRTMVSGCGASEPTSVSNSNTSAGTSWRWSSTRSVTPVSVSTASEPPAMCTVETRSSGSARMNAFAS